MTIFRGNDTNLDTEPLTDENDNPITSGDVRSRVLTIDEATVLLAEASMTHLGGGVWRRIVQGEQGNALPDVRDVLHRVTVGPPATPDATFERVELVAPRRSN